MSHRRNEPRRMLKKGNRKVSSRPIKQEVHLLFKEEGSVKYRKRYLILCEGDTEYIYLTGVKNNILLEDQFSALEIDILRPIGGAKGESKGNDRFRDNSLKGMVLEAMRRKKLAEKDKNPFDQIWLVIDNDRRNSYIITKYTLERVKAKEILNEIDFEEFSNYRMAFFLSGMHYRDFLSSTFDLDEDSVSSIITNTDKHCIFEKYIDADPKKMFYSDDGFTESKNKYFFDITWKQWLGKAYSCYSFEIWLILHFNNCKLPFWGSDEAIVYLKKNAPNYCKGFGDAKISEYNAYDILKPPDFNPKYETEIEARAVIEKIETAMLYAHWLRDEMQGELALQGGRYYEVNPYTDVDFLLAILLEKEITYGHFETIVTFGNLEILCSIDMEASRFRVRLKKLDTTGRIMINNENLANFFRILSITKDHKHMTTAPEAISKTLYIPPEENQKTFSFLLHFSEIPKDLTTYLEFRNDQDHNYLYFPIRVN